MTRKLPVAATLIVAVAVAVMVALGVWQLRRAGEKDALLDRYRSAQSQPAVAFPTSPIGDSDLPLFRKASGLCLKPVSKRVTAGRNRAGEVGYSHIVDCSTGAEGPGMAVELGWSKDPNARFAWSGGQVAGLIVPDRKMRLRIVADQPPAGLLPSAPASIEEIPNNHRSYALQWFLFALIALVIYALALRSRLKPERPAQ